VARILVANDDLDLLDTCREVLERAGHTIRAVASGKLALELARHWNPDLALFDWKMPDMEGTAAIRALRADPLTAPLPILMMSGSDSGPEEAARAGASGFLRKPFDADELVSRVAEMLAAAAGAGLPR
jgi:CheY-like chemotaxis protein